MVYSLHFTHFVTPPSSLKSFIDHVVRSGRTFTTDEIGFHGRLKDKKMVVINSRGAAYADEAIAKLDHVTPYLITIFGFIGIIDIKFIYFEPTAFSGEEAKKKLFVSPKR